MFLYFKPPTRLAVSIPGSHLCNPKMKIRYLRRWPSLDFVTPSTPATTRNGTSSSLRSMGVVAAAFHHLQSHESHEGPTRHAHPRPGPPAIVRLHELLRARVGCTQKLWIMPRTSSVAKQIYLLRGQPRSHAVWSHHIMFDEPRLVGVAILQAIFEQGLGSMCWIDAHASVSCVSSRVSLCHIAPQKFSTPLKTSLRLVPKAGRAIR